MSSKGRVRDTDALLHTSEVNVTSYGLNPDSDNEEDEDGKSAGRTFLSIRGTKERVWTVAIFSFIACIGSLLIGMFLGFSTNTLSELNYWWNQGDKTYGLSSSGTLASLFGAFGPLGALFGGPLAWPISDKFGRKPALMLGCVPALVGWLLFSFANLLPVRKAFLGFLLAGRLLSGFSSGWTIFCVSVYIAEISTANLKGLFGNCNQLFITIGIFLVEALGSHYKSFLTYNHVALIPSWIAAIFIVLLLFTKETPRWLYKQNQDRQANHTLNFLRGPKADIPKEIRGIQNAIADMKGITVLDQLKAFRHRSVLLPFALVLMLMFFQQFSGINAAIFYSTQIFEKAKVSNPPLVTLLAVGLVQIFATLLSVILVDLLGRKTLLVLSSSGMLLSSAMLGAYFLVFNTYCCGHFGGTCNYNLSVCHTAKFGGLAIASVVVYIVSFSLGWGPIPWSMMSELLPLQVRGLAASLATLVNWTFAFIITVAFNDYANKVTPKFAWWSFSVVLFASIFCILFLLPETKGHKLEDIERHFKKGKILYNPFKRERLFNT